MEGLEVSEVLLSKIDLGDRCDSEFFEKEDLRVEHILKGKNSQELRNFGSFVASAFYPAATQLYEIGDTPFIRCVDCINYPLITKEQENSFEKIPLYFVNEQSGVNTLRKGDIVITKVGTPSFPSLIYEYELVALSRTVMGIKNITGINKYYLLTFLRSKYGFSQLQRHRELTIQYQLTLERTKRTLIYVPIEELQDKIESLIHNYIKGINIAKNLYLKAETLLLETIGLKNFTPSIDPINIKSYKDSFLTSSRLDSEYYQKKYEDYNKLIRDYKNGYEVLKDSCNLKDINFIPSNKTEYKYIELVDIGKTGDIKSCTYAKGIELPSRARRKVNANDVIISSIEGSLESCAFVTEEYNNALCSTGFYVINSDKINSETLLVLFKSEPMQNILKQNCSGTILTAINKQDILNIPVPLIEKKVQLKIKEKISESFELKKESEHLLDTAKRAVEIAIEQNETEAINYINQIIK